MFRNIGSVFLSLIFLALLAAPTIISLVDDSVDISVFYSTSEEEEKGSETSKTIEVVFNNPIGNDANFSFTKSINHHGYYFKTYPKPHLNLISPPPEFHIL
jgi:hypothetical protein